MSILTAPIAEANDFVLSQNPWKPSLTSLSSYKAGQPSIARAREESDNIFNEYNSLLSKFSNCENFEIFPFREQKYRAKIGKFTCKKELSRFP